MPHIDTKGQGVGEVSQTRELGAQQYSNKSEVPAVRARSLEGIGCRGFSPQTVPVRLLTRSPWDLLLFFLLARLPVSCRLQCLHDSANCGVLCCLKGRWSRELRLCGSCCLASQRPWDGFRI